MTDDPNPDRAELVPTSSRRLTPPRSSERCTDCSGDAVGASEQPDQDIHKDRQPDRQQQRQHQAARHEADLGTLTGPLREEKHEALLYPRSRSATGGARTTTGVRLVALPVTTGEYWFRERNSLPELPPRHLLCVVEGCVALRVSRGRCNRHYQALYREQRGDRKRASDRRWRERVGYNAQRRKPRQTRVCAAPACEESFETAIPHRLYCSRSCKKRADNRRFRGSGSGR
jgi:hypothetical protein